ncbi:MAG: general secretion pathway protein GspK [Xanthobacteraceae bacterium]
MHSTDHRHHRPGHDGFIIVAVMWILMALATLASIYSIHVANSAVARSVSEDRIRADGLVSAAIELTAYSLSIHDKAKRPTRGQFGFRLGKATISVRFLSEAARIDLNSAPKPLLMGLFAALGAQGEAAEQYADRIIGWRTAPKAGADDKEDARYRAAGLRYGPRGGPFGHLDELWLVQGLPPALIERAMPYVTIYSGRSDINVLDAAPLAIAALPGMSAARLNAFLSQRESLPPDTQVIAAALGSDQPGAGTTGSNAYRVDIGIGFDNGTRAGAEVIILVEEDDGLYRVLSWRDDLDAPPASSNAGGT